MISLRLEKRRPRTASRTDGVARRDGRVETREARRDGLEETKVARRDGLEETKVARRDGREQTEERRKDGLEEIGRDGRVETESRIDGPVERGGPCRTDRTGGSGPTGVTRQARGKEPCPGSPPGMILPP